MNAPEIPTKIPAEIRTILTQILPQIIALRQDLHIHPELSEHEERTAGRVSEILTQYGIAHETKIAGMHGIVATIEGTKSSDSPAKTIAFRGDMDALPIEEKNDVPYKSQNPGVMHACGHDGHTANLVGTALALQSLRHTFSGRVKCIFQPAEETVNGAKFLCEVGVMDGVDAVIMLHGWPDLPVGTIGLRTGPAMASSDSWGLKITGVGGHAAYPHLTVDPIMVGAQIVNTLQTLVAREVSPLLPAVVSVTRFHAGTANNIIPTEAILSGTVRTLDDNLRKSMPERLERIVKGICAATRATYTFTWHEGTPPVINDADVTALIREVATETIGRQNMVEMPEATMGAEDFSFYLMHAPGAMVRLGTGCPYKLHHPQYDFGDGPLETGIALFVALAQRFLV
jgi:amidohydrolase